jgi:hypothetical protein
MFLEHIFYSTTIAIIIGLFVSSYKWKDHSWIIIAVAFLPDIDAFLRIFFGIFFKLTGSFHQYVLPYNFHEYLHTFAALLGFALLGSIFFVLFGIRLIEGFIYTAIGWGTHLFEDALVYTMAYPFLWPFYSGRFGWGILPAAQNWFGIANAETLTIGILTLFCAVSLRVLIQGTEWLPRIS